MNNTMPSLHKNSAKLLNFINYEKSKTKHKLAKDLNDKVID